MLTVEQANQMILLAESIKNHQMIIANLEKILSEKQKKKDAYQLFLKDAYHQVETLTKRKEALARLPDTKEMRESLQDCIDIHSCTVQESREYWLNATEELEDTNARLIETRRLLKEKEEEMTILVDLSGGTLV